MNRVRVAFDMDVERLTDAAKVLEKMLAAADGTVENFSWTMRGQVPFYAAERNGRRVSRVEKKVARRVSSDY